MKKRLKSLRKLLGLNQAEMGKKMKLSQTHISSLENGAREITDRIINDVCREFNVSEDWLRTGEGEMFIQPDTFSLDEKAKQHNLSELEIDIMKGYMELPVTTRNDLLALFGSIYKKQSEITTTEEKEEEDSIKKELEQYRRILEAKNNEQAVTSDVKISSQY